MIVPFGFSGISEHRILRSLRFNDGDSAYLSKTPSSATNRDTWTFSAWLKRCSFGANQCILQTGTAGSDSTTFTFRFNSSDQLDAQSGATVYRITNAVYRDPSAWLHIVLAFDTTQATAANRVKLYVNGSEVTSFATNNNPTQNADHAINNNQEHVIGRHQDVAQYFDGYMAEINLIDGSALTPSSFGYTDASTGAWMPKKYSGSYGTNGFYLDFSDNSNTTAATLGADRSGNGNNWTPNNFSVSAGVGNDSLTDSPTNMSGSTNGGGNYATWSSINTSGSTLANGNLDITAGANVTTLSTMRMTYGKWYAESVFSANTSQAIFGIWRDVGTFPPSSDPGFNSNSYAWYLATTAGNRGVWTNSAQVFAVSAMDTTYTMLIAVDVDAGKLWFGLYNGSSTSWYDSSGGTTGDPANGSNATVSITAGMPLYFAGQASANTLSTNFGQRPFTSTPPTGFKSLCTANLPFQRINPGGKFFNVVTYTGTGATQNITGVGFQPDLVWIKCRSAAENHHLYDSARGAGIALFSSLTNAENNYGTDFQSGFLSDGFSLGAATGGGINVSGRTYVSWCWKESATSGFDIVTYTGNGSNRTISHSLGAAPKLMIIKHRSSALYHWAVYHGSRGAGEYCGLDTTSAFDTSNASLRWNSTDPDSSVFSLGTSAEVNENGSGYIAYLWAEVPGFSRFGSYTGNGSADGPFVFCGFRPRFILIKASSAAGYSWYMNDTTRDPYNIATNELFAESTAAEPAGGAGDFGDILSNGFKIRTTRLGYNESGTTFIFAAFAEMPDKISRAR